jgi:hypothetical protein
MTKLKNCIGSVPTPRSKSNPATQTLAATGRPRVVGSTPGYKNKMAAPARITKSNN